MIYQLTVESVKAIFNQDVGAGPLLDAGALSGAVMSPYGGFAGSEFYPSLPQKAGKLLDAVQDAQAYLDGNKRLAWICATTFLQLNGQLLIEMPDPVVEAFVLSLVGAPDAPQVAADWLNDRMIGMQ